MIPPYDGQPRCDVCGRPAQHLWVDMREIPPRRVTDTFGKYLHHEQQFENVARHHRCELHPGQVMRYLLDGTVEIDGDLVAT
jgi:hypothetical protein